MVRLLVAVLALSLFAGSALAHRLKVFARVEGGEILGSAYFVGGAPAAGVEIRVLGPDGSVLARPVPDPEGRFRYRPATPADYLVEVDSGDGHVARWKLAATEFAAAPAPAADQQQAGRDGEATDASDTVGDRSPPAALPAPVTDPALAALVEEAVARQVGPLREQLQGYEDKVRLHDVLGGIGYILGLAGVALWWRSRNGGGR